MMISPQNQQLLNKAVFSSHFETPEEALSEALRLLLQQTENVEAPPAILPPAEWIEEFDRITASRRGGNPNMDDSRDSIYGDRGL